MRGDRTAIFTAAAEAERACRFLHAQQPVATADCAAQA